MAEWQMYKDGESEQEDQREPEIYPDDQIPELEVGYLEYECGAYCSPTGCHGHYTDVPVSICLDNVVFEVYGYESGDYPMSKAETEEAKSVVKRLELALEKARLHGRLYEGNDNDKVMKVMEPMLDKTAQELGFDDFAEVSKMVAGLDLTKPGVMDRFMKWRHEDGSKAGLEKLMDDGGW